MMSQGMRKLESVTAKNKSTIVFINQVREKIGVTFGNPEVTPGGRALKFHASIRMEITKGAKLRDDDAVIGFHPKLKIVKTKVGGQPFAEAEYNIHSGNPVSGIDLVASLVDVGLDGGILNKKGNFVWYDKTNLGNGMANAYDTLRSDPQLTLDLKNQIYDGLYAEIEKKRELSKMVGGGTTSVRKKTAPGSSALDITDAIAEISDGD
jgi:recombination protein RecA